MMTIIGATILMIMIILLVILIMITSLNKNNSKSLINNIYNQYIILFINITINNHNKQHQLYIIIVITT